MCALWGFGWCDLNKWIVGVLPSEVNIIAILLRVHCFKMNTKCAIKYVPKQLLTAE